MEKSRAIELLEHLAWDRDIERNPYGDALNMAIEALKAQLSKEGTTSDLISRTETAEHLRRVLDATVPVSDYDEGYVDGVEFGISTVSTMPTIQPEPHEGEWEQVSAQRYFMSASYFYRCSACGVNNVRNTNYCPNCGSYNGGGRK
jgi:hypothetical protein